MNIEKQYPSPNRCKKLAKLGFPYDTEFFMRVSDKAILKGKGPSGVDYYPCPSVPEMLEVMPDVIIHHYKSGVRVYEKDAAYTGKRVFDNSNLANAVSDCLIWLVENKFISFTEKING